MRLFLWVLSASLAWAQLAPPDNPLAAYLELTPQQIQTIGQNQREYAAFANAREPRTMEVRRELRLEHLRYPADALALGSRYGELETIRREIAARAAIRANANLDVLTSAQRSKIAALERSRRLLALASDAQCSGMVESPNETDLPDYGFSDGPPFLRGSEYFSFCIALDWPQALFTYLELSAVQVAAINAAALDFAQWLSSRRPRTDRLLAEIDSLSAAEPLDSSALGSRYAEVQDIAKENRVERAQTGSRIRSVLTENQKTRLSALGEASRLSPLAYQAACVGLLDAISFASDGVRPANLPTSTCGF